jgi:hypothetical protein
MKTHFIALLIGYCAWVTAPMALDLHAQAPATAVDAVIAEQAPAILPGKGLAQHDFFYAGEAKNERMFSLGSALLDAAH